MDFRGAPAVCRRSGHQGGVEDAQPIGMEQGLTRKSDGGGRDAPWAGGRGLEQKGRHHPEVEAGPLVAGTVHQHTMADKEVGETMLAGGLQLAVSLAALSRRHDQARSPG